MEKGNVANARTGRWVPPEPHPANTYETQYACASCGIRTQLIPMLFMCGYNRGFEGGRNARTMCLFRCFFTEDTLLSKNCKALVSSPGKDTATFMYQSRLEQLLHFAAAHYQLPLDALLQI
jgi:hypothetical protein